MSDLFSPYNKVRSAKRGTEWAFFVSPLPCRTVGGFMVETFSLRGGKRNVTLSSTLYRYTRWLPIFLNIPPLLFFHECACVCQRARFYMPHFWSPSFMGPFGSTLQHRMPFPIFNFNTYLFMNPYFFCLLGTEKEGRKKYEKKWG